MPALRRGAKTTLIAYAGTAHVVMPATLDEGIINTFAQALDPKIMPDEGEAAATTFARVPGPNGAFNQGNAWLMHGKYDQAIASYDRALSIRPGWKEAEENKALAAARRAKIEASGEKREQQQAEAYEPDKIVFDQKGADKKGQPVEISNGKMSDEELRATWLRGVQTTPGDFLRAKFAYQAAQKNKERPR